MDYERTLQRLLPKADGESPVRHRTGVISAVNGDGTVDVDLGGEVIGGCSILGSTTVGAVVQVLAWAGDLLVLGSASGAGIGYRQGVPIYITASGTFAKAAYPDAIAFLVEVQAGGGGGVGNGNGNGTAGPGGGGGGYARSILLASALAASEPITVGNGGAASNGFVQASTGGSSSFGSHVAANGGQGAGGGTGAGTSNGFGGLGGTATTGQLRIDGGDGDSTGDQAAKDTPGGTGGNSHLGKGGRGGPIRSTDVGGSNGRLYGGGGGGGHRTTALINGGNGAAGIIIITPLYP